MDVPLPVAGDDFDGVFLCCPFSIEMFWMRTETELSQVLRAYLPTLPLHTAFQYNPTNVLI